MGAYYAKQPNDLYCRFSTVVDSVTDWNITKEQAINMQLGYLNVTPAEQKIREDIFDKRLKPFEKIKEDFTAANDTIEEFQDLLKEMGDTEGYKKMFYEDFNNGSDTISCVRSWGYLDYDEPIAMKWLDHYCDFNKYAMTTKVTYNGKVIFEGKLE